MKRASTYTSLAAVLVLAACGSEPETRVVAGGRAAAAPAAGPSTAAPAAPAAQRGVAPGAPAASAGAEELRAGEPGAAGRPAAPGRGTAAPAPAAAARSAAAPAAEAPPATETTQDAAAVLRRAERAYDGIRSLEADFTQAVTIPLLETTQQSRGKLYIRRPDRFLMKFSQPEGDIVVADGSYFWMYYPSADPKQVMRASVGDGSRQVDLQQEFLSNPTERYHAVLGGAETVDGRSAQVVVLTPKGPSGYRRVRIWVDREDALVRRFEIIEENESVRRLDLRGLRPNVALGDQLFRFSPPPGTQVFTQQ